MTRVVFALLAAALFCSVTQVQAGPITYSLTTTASGRLGASSFTNALATVTLTGNTSNVIPVIGGPATGLLGNPGTTTVSIFGLGTATFTAPTGIFSTFNDLTLFGGSVVSIGQFVGPLNNLTDITSILAEKDPVFFGYDLRGSLGPVSGTGGSSAPDPNAVFPTTLGILNFTAPPFGTGTTTFTATTVPEPGTVVLLGCGMAALVVRSRFKPRK